MLEIIILIVIIYFIVKAVNKNKKKTTTKTPASTPASKPASKPASTSTAKKAAPSGGDEFSGMDKDAFARAMAAMSGDAPAPKKTASAPASNEAEDRKWVRDHAFTSHLCSFYARSWGPDGGIYEKVNSGDLPIVRLELRVDSDKIHETLHLKDGGNFESDTTFESFDFSGKYDSLNTAAKRSELLKCLTERLASLSTISAKSDGFHILTGSAAKKAEPVEPAEPQAPAGGGDFPGVDKDAFARAMAHMGGDTPAPKKEEPKKEEPKAAAPTGESDQLTGEQEELYKAFLSKILAYYHTMWNKENGTLYSELDTTMPIDHFAIQVRENCLVESVWLIGDEIPLVTETEYTKLCGDTPVYPMSSANEQTKLLVLIAKFLMELGTVEVKGNDFYPIRSKKAAAPTPPPEKPAGDGKAPDEFTEADKEAALRAQVQAMLEQQIKGDKDK